jgi:hypothetical protein
VEILRLLRPKHKKQFVSADSFSTNRGRQSHLAIETLVRLRDVNVEEEDKLKIDYIFCANSLENLQELSRALQNLDSTVEHKFSIKNKKLFIIKGQTSPVKMAHEILRKWAIEMCELGYKFDCDFESWEILLHKN